MPLFLSIDTSFPRMSASLVENEEVLGECLFEEGYRSERLPELVNRVLQLGAKSLEDVDCLLVCTGPGSFTGIRAGLAFMQGLSWSIGKPLVGVSSLVAGVGLVSREDSLVVTWLRASVQERFAAIFELKNQGGSASNTSLDTWRLKELNPGLILPEENFDSELKKLACDEVVLSEVTSNEKNPLSTQLARVCFLGSCFTKSSIQLAAWPEFAGESLEMVLAKLPAGPRKQDSQLTPLYLKPVQAKTLEQRGVAIA